MPYSLKAAACLSKPGSCSFEQVGVKAPGRENNTTFLPLKRYLYLYQPTRLVLLL